MSHFSFFVRLYRLTDIVLLFLSLALATSIRFQHFGFTESDQLLYFFSVITWFMSANFTNLYSLEWRPSLFSKYIVTMQTALIFLLSLLAGALVFKHLPYSRIQLLLFALIQGTFVLVVHEVLIRAISFFRHHNYNKSKIIIIGHGSQGLKAAHEIKIHPESGRELLGFLDKKTDHSDVIADATELDNLIHNPDFPEFQEVIIAVPVSEIETIREIMDTCDDHGIRVHLMLDYTRWYDIPIEVSYFGTLPVATVGTFPLDNMFHRFQKRVMDIVLSGFGLLVLSPLFIVLAILIKLGSKGPAFFVQKRTGYSQKEFDCLKFRSMRVSADADTKQATEDDPRKTKLGDFMRRTNLDELPQLINVFKGEMSLVGPRPHMLKHTGEFKEQVSAYMRRHFVKPGITGWAQVNGWRGPTDTQEKIEMRVKFDLEYIEKWSILLDIKILLKTVFSKKTKENAF